MFRWGDAGRFGRGESGWFGWGEFGRFGWGWFAGGGRGGEGAVMRGVVVCEAGWESGGAGFDEWTGQ